MPFFWATGPLTMPQGKVKLFQEEITMPTIAERLKLIEEKEVQLRNKRELLENKMKADARRARNRQNIIAGALLTELAFSGPEEAKRYIATMEKRLTREQDKKAMAPLLNELRAIAAAPKEKKEPALDLKP